MNAALLAERAGLLRDILTHPAEDGPRLIFADWLEEYGDKSDREWAGSIRQYGGEYQWMPDSPPPEPAPAGMAWGGRQADGR